VQPDPRMQPTAHLVKLAQLAQQRDLGRTTVRRWWARYQAEGAAALGDRSRGQPADGTVL
jgi:transposase